MTKIKRVTRKNIEKLADLISLPVKFFEKRWMAVLGKWRLD